jgi:hypothetical protein
MVRLNLFAALAGVSLLMCVQPGLGCEASRSLQPFRSDWISIDRPENWIPRANGNIKNVLIAPQGHADDKGQITCGMLIGRIDNLQNVELSRLTADLIEQYRKSNPTLTVLQGGRPIMVDGIPGLRTPLSTTSGSVRERNDLVTVFQAGSLTYFILISPEGELWRLDPVFQTMVNSARLGGVSNPAVPVIVPSTAGRPGMGSEFRTSQLSFQYPQGWRLADRSPADGKFTFLTIMPPTGGPQQILVRYYKTVPNVLCGVVHQNFVSAFRQESNGFWQERFVTESFDAGNVTTSSLTRQDQRPPANLVSTVCSNGDVAQVVYEYDHTRLGREPRDLVMRTLAFASVGLAGEWRGPGDALRFDENGTVRQWFTSMLNESRGTYRHENGRLVITWDVVMSVPKRAVWDCASSITGAKLTLSCQGIGTMVYSR